MYPHRFPSHRHMDRQTDMQTNIFMAPHMQAKLELCMSIQSNVTIIQANSTGYPPPSQNAFLNVIVSATTSTPPHIPTTKNTT